MKQSRNMSRIQRTTTTPFLPTIPIEVWFETQPFHTWSVVEDDDDSTFEFISKSEGEFEDEVKFFRGSICKAFSGTEYLDNLLTINTPQQLVTFMNTYACPIDSIVQDPGDGEWHRVTVPFPFSTFIEARTKLEQAMRLPMPTLLRHKDFKSFFDLEALPILAERKGTMYHGIVTMSPSVEACYRVVAIERLLANVEYGFCDRCGTAFRVSSKHKRKYCDTATCGHAVAQARYRESLKKPKKRRSKV